MNLDWGNAERSELVRASCRWKEGREGRQEGRREGRREGRGKGREDAVEERGVEARRRGEGGKNEGRRRQERGEKKGRRRGEGGKKEGRRRQERGEKKGRRREEEGKEEGRRREEGGEKRRRRRGGEEARERGVFGGLKERRGKGGGLEGWPPPLKGPPSREARGPTAVAASSSAALSKDIALSPMHCLAALSRCASVSFHLSCLEVGLLQSLDANFHSALPFTMWIVRPSHRKCVNLVRGLLGTDPRTPPSNSPHPPLLNFRSIWHRFSIDSTSISWFDPVSMPIDPEGGRARPIRRWGPQGLCLINPHNVDRGSVNGGFRTVIRVWFFPHFNQRAPNPSEFAPTCTRGPKRPKQTCTNSHPETLRCKLRTGTNLHKFAPPRGRRPSGGPTRSGGCKFG